jgi:hypothetical protein
MVEAAGGFVGQDGPLGFLDCRVHSFLTAVHTAPPGSPVPGRPDAFRHLADLTRIANDRLPETRLINRRHSTAPLAEHS